MLIEQNSKQAFMPIDCALVAFETVFIAKGSVGSTSYDNLIVKIMVQIDWAKTTVQTFEQNGKIVFLCVENKNIVFLGVCDLDVSIRQRFRFLIDLKSLWHTKYGNQNIGLAPNSKDDEFGPTIINLIKNYNSGHLPTKKNENLPKNSSQENDNSQMNDYLMPSNRIDDFDVDEQRAAEIRQDASVFRHTASIKCRLFYQRYKIFIIVIPIILFILLMILFSVCGFTFKKC